MDICSECGEPIGVGDWPFCPHGPAGRLNYGSFREYTDVMMDDHPIEVTSPGHKRQLMKERNLDYHGRKVGMPGCEV